MKITPSDMFCFSLYAATHALQQAYRPLLAPLGLTYPQYLVMRALWASDGPMTVGAIGQAVQLESSTLTPLLKRLQIAGLLSRSRDPEDERQVRVALSEKGHALEVEAEHIPGCIVELSGLPVTELQRLQADINGMTARLRQTD